ncbi:MAG: hypothetical protein KA138_00135 [Saprospiraceae bacterium]|nr:hypothetical protein [Lewinellaceae bacterium]MBP6809896.1 hypothetical protein [Saprospiraceae bacterium]
MDSESKKSATPKVVDPTPTKPLVTEPKSVVRAKAEEAEQKNLEEQRQILQETDELAAGLFKAAIEVQKQSEIGGLRENLAELRTAINQLKYSSALSIPQRPAASAANTGQDPAHEDCGCGCGEPKTKKCCIEVYGSGVRVLRAADGIVPNLELILAIGIGGVKGVYPGLTSQINVNQNVGWVKVDWPITKICVPCEGSLTLPVTIEAMDIDKMLSVPEKGGTTGEISLNCNCITGPRVFEVNLSSGSMLPGEKKGVILVEVSTRRVNGDCCC